MILPLSFERCERYEIEDCPIKQSHHRPCQVLDLRCPARTEVKGLVPDAAVFRGDQIMRAATPMRGLIH
jgi:hypothetical protein